MKEKVRERIFPYVVLFGLCLLSFFGFPNRSFAYNDCGGAPSYCAAQVVIGGYTTCSKSGTTCTPSGYKTRVENCNNNWDPSPFSDCAASSQYEFSSCWYEPANDTCVPMYSPKITHCCVIVCDPAGTCPTGCGYGGGTVPDGNCGQKICGATGSCCPAAGTCPTTCHTNTQTVPNGSCGTISCPSNAPAAGTCPTTCHTNTQTVPNGSCGTISCPSNAPAAGTCTTNCGANADVPNGACGTTPCACIACAPDAPVIISPAVGAQLRVGVPVTVDWNDIANWGTGCPNSNHYMACVSSDDVNCDLLGNWNLGLTSQYSYTFLAPDPTAFMFAASNNGSLSTWDDRRIDVCVEGGDSVTAWSAWSPVPDPLCGITQTRTRTCSENCGTDDCNAYFASKVGCDVAANCSYVGNTQTETRTLPACATPPDKPIPVCVTPLTAGISSVLDWNDIAWGIAFPPPNTNRYNVCLSNNNVECNLGFPSTGTTSQKSYTPATGNLYWAVISYNGSLQTWSDTCTVCVEGFDNGASFSYVSNWTWGMCGVNHTRSATRTCTETCGVDDCNAFMADPANCPAGSTCTYNAVTKTQTRTEDCVGTITGTLFDASDISSCSDMGSVSKFEGITVSMTPDVAGKWPVINTPITGADGVYSASVYAPAAYSIDPALLASGVGSALRWSCDGSGSNIPVSSQAQTVTRSFGFWRDYGGWWQAEGASVYAETGLKSFIPASVSPVGNQKLILADTNGRTGVLSHGFTWSSDSTTELGTNPSVGVSDILWRIKSLYGGQTYDYGFFNTRMDVFTLTDWDGGVITYVDGGNGYQIFKHTGDVTLDYTGPTGIQKVILLVDGNVTVNSNVTVPSGAFLGVIASGNITFGSAVTNAEGWFVAENINVPCKDTAPADGACDKDDVQFTGEGSFVGWAGINLGRNMGVGNNTAPAEKFTYRPDMFVNAPTSMKVYAKRFSPFIP